MYGNEPTSQEESMDFQRRLALETKVFVDHGVHDYATVLSSLSLTGEGK